VGDWLITLIGVLAGIALLWVALVAVLLIENRRHGDATRAGELVRLIPDVIRLVRRLCADPTVPQGTRLLLAALLVYPLLPIDLVPDFLPVIGSADDAIATALVLRFAARHAGAEAVTRHWPGTKQGLRALRRLLGL
jgi:uncharacterized membrane protein YkvA (DUF1232 family)